MQLIKLLNFTPMLGMLLQIATAVGMIGGL